MLELLTDNPHTQLQSCRKVIAFVLTSAGVFPPLENIQFIGELLFLQESKRWGETF